MLRGGALRLDALVADAHLHRADQAGVADRLQTALDEVRRGGLARGSGDADLEQVAPGVAVDRGRELAHASARVVDHEDRQAGGLGPLGTGRVGQHGDRAETGRLGHVVGTVQAGAGQRGVEVAGAHGAGVVGDARDLRGRRRGVGTQLIGELREGCCGVLDRSRRPRICHRNALLGDLGLISVWHGGERTGLTPPERSEGRGEPWLRDPG